LNIILTDDWRTILVKPFSYFFAVTVFTHA